MTRRRSKRPGRPPADPATKRGVPRSIRLTADLDARVTAAAERADQSFSAWMSSAAQLALARGSTR